MSCCPGAGKQWQRVGAMNPTLQIVPRGKTQVACVFFTKQFYPRHETDRTSRYLALVINITKNPPRLVLGTAPFAEPPSLLRTSYHSIPFFPPHIIYLHICGSFLYAYMCPIYTLRDVLLSLEVTQSRSVVGRLRAMAHRIVPLWSSSCTMNKYMRLAPVRWDHPSVQVFPSHFPS
jgi:hypothetical protein